MNRLYIGCDPGKKGALAIIDGENVSVYPFDEQTYRSELKIASKMPCVCCLENVKAMPEQGRSSTFVFGTNFGFLQGMLYDMKSKTDTVSIDMLCGVKLLDDNLCAVLADKRAV